MEIPTDLEALLSVAEARAILGDVSRATIYRLIATGELPIVKVVARTMFEPVAVREYIARHRQSRASECAEDGCPG